MGGLGYWTVEVALFGWWACGRGTKSLGCQILAKTYGMKRRVSVELAQKIRGFRKNPIPAEKLLWEKLRDRG
ncbi:MAG TPA: hypothetical protein EYP17_07530 [Candidatus Latescibacteria bacterium]|nr:hypothetical protein [Candidatus Latescibacterota bacterium]